jgi:hypothetical protein
LYNSNIPCRTHYDDQLNNKNWFYFLLDENKTGTRELQLQVYTLFGWEIIECHVRTVISMNNEVGDDRCWTDVNTI